MLTACVKSDRYGVDRLRAACEALRLRTAENVGYLFVEVPRSRRKPLAEAMRERGLHPELLFFIDAPDHGERDALRELRFRANLGGRGTIIQVDRGLWGLGKWVPLWWRSEVVPVNYDGGLNVPTEMLRSIDAIPNGKLSFVRSTTEDGGAVFGLQAQDICFPHVETEVLDERPVDRRGRVRLTRANLAHLGPRAERYVVTDEWAWLEIEREIESS